MLQHLVSLILHRGHAGKKVRIYIYMIYAQVYRRLQRLFLCLSHERTNGFLGKDYNREVLEWRDEAYAE